MNAVSGARRTRSARILDSLAHPCLLLFVILSYVHICMFSFSFVLAHPCVERDFTHLCAEREREYTRAQRTRSMARFLDSNTESNQYAYNHAYKYAYRYAYK
eukprot:Tamp_38349.p2 GENE.Tamp_38349~~Tamp_38349.p2  ORF type:complete len:102 (-),score=1.46 Tamp_38349:20-325(-)